MITEDVALYASRDWDAVEAATARYWASEKARMNATQLFALVDGFRAGLCQTRPDWPSHRQRDEDLAHHVELAGLLRRAVIHADR